MSDKEHIKVEITQDKLVDLLLHAATREDIAKFANEAKIDNEKYRNESKADNEKLRNELKADINITNTATLKALESFEARNDRQFHKIDQRYNWIIGIIIGTGIAICGLMVTLAGFVIKYHS